MWRLLLVLVLVLSVAVRVIPVNYGHPAPAAFSSDEVDSISRALKMAQGDLMPLHASKPTFYNAVVGATLGVHFAIEKLAHGATREEFERAFFLEPFPLYRTARLVSVAASCALLILLLVSLRRSSLPARLWAVAIVGLGPSSVYYGYVAKEDALAALLVFAAFWLALESAAALGRRALWLNMAAAAAAGLAVSTKYNCFFAALFPLLAPLPGLPRRTRLAAAVAAGAVVGAAFCMGTPFAILHPTEFVNRALGSAVARQVAGSFAYIHNLGKTGPAFVGELLWVELSLNAGAVGWALWETARGRTGIPRAMLFGPLGLYGAALLVSSQLDYQYAVLLSPIFAFAVARACDTPCDTRPRGAIRGAMAVATFAACLWNVFGPDAKSVLRRTVAYTRTDPRVEAAKQIDGYLNILRSEVAPARDLSTLKAIPTTDRPLLIASPFYFRYYPPLAFDTATYEHLRDQARASGGEGGYFERAAKYAAEDTRTTVPARFLEIKTSFHRLPDGMREFDPQPFPLDPTGYDGRYSMVIVPGNTRRILDLNLPELAPLNRLLRHLTAGRKLAEFGTRGEGAGPTIELFEAP